jgi:hypothetical protein
MTAAAAAAAAIAQAIKASGVIVRLEPAEFIKILGRQDEPLVVQARGGFFRSSWRYLTSYKGLAFCTESAEQLLLPGRAQIVAAASIWIPR